MKTFTEKQIIEAVKEICMIGDKDWVYFSPGISECGKRLLKKLGIKTKTIGSDISSSI